MLENQVRFNDARSDSSFDSDTEEDKNEEKKEDAIPPPPVFYKVIHRIRCDDNMNHRHDERLSVDVPVSSISSSGTKGGISARNEILNLNAYLRRWPALTFYVIQDHDCERTVKSRASHILSTRPAETMVILSPILTKAFEEVAEFKIYEDEDGDRINEFKAPYHFLFHHHQKLTSLAETEPYGSALPPLLGYLKDNYEEEYEDAREMFRQGYVNSRHFFKLFKPNQMVLVRKGSDDLAAFVLHSYVRIKKSNDKEKILFDGWSWSYNGTEFLRTQWEKTIDPRTVPTEKTLIADLGIHPVDFARAEDVEKLTARGKTFWSMRGHVYSCYTGWDQSYSRHFVSWRSFRRFEKAANAPDI